MGAENTEGKLLNNLLFKSSDLASWPRYCIPSTTGPFSLPFSNLYQNHPPPTQWNN